MRTKRMRYPVRPRRRWLLPAAIGLSLALAGCTSSGAIGGGDQPTPGASPSATSLIVDHIQAAADAQPALRVVGTVTQIRPNFVHYQSCHRPCRLVPYQRPSIRSEALVASGPRVAGQTFDGQDFACEWRSPDIQPDDTPYCGPVNGQPLPTIANPQTDWLTAHCYVRGNGEQGDNGADASTVWYAVEVPQNHLASGTSPVHLGAVAIGYVPDAFTVHTSPTKEPPLPHCTGDLDQVA